MRLLLAAVVAGIGFYAVNVAHYIREPLRVEENEWPPMGRAVNVHGKPLIRYGEDHRVKLLPDFQLDTSNYVGLWHPPLYMYTMAGFMAVAGTQATGSLRVIGAIALLISSGLLFLISRELSRSRWPLVGSIASTLLLIHPYGIQGSLFLDIDTSIYAPTFLLFVWLLLRSEGRRSIGLPELALVGAFALILWTKLPTAFVLVAVSALYWLVRLGPGRGMLRIGVVFLGGTALFLLSYGLYVAVTDQSFWYTFRFTLLQKGTSRLFYEQPFAVVQSAFSTQVAWFSPFLVLITLAYGLLAAMRWIRDRQITPLDYIWGLGVAIFLAFGVVAPNASPLYQGKYAFPALPLLILAAVAFLARAWPERRDRAAWAFAVLVGVVAAGLMPDLLTDQHFVLQHTGPMAALVLGSAAALWIAVRGLRGSRWLPPGALAVCFVVFLAQSIHSYRANTSPLYPTSDTNDFRQGVDYVNRHLRAGDVVVAPKDLAFYVKGPVIEGEDIWLVRGDHFEAQVLRTMPKVRMLATDSFGPPLGGETMTALNECFQRRVFGSASVYERKPQCQSTS